ncbi:hypothetical protein KCN56_08830 [Photobacterium galatheae]|uniref:DUF3885 domain-containing protein n=1 Tax=Photobacterium galatheae TaxID=1654360 RepID=UPI00202CC06B|nr:hypothetical protein [Photobacterium galatheae]MCM0148661.1 hypothetical protein [Photobacterium galatheae]
MIKELTLFWKREFNDFFPEAHSLKHEYQNRWVRFHSLPESKRYPENEEEYLEIFRRHNTVLQALVGSKARILVVLPEYSNSEAPKKPEPALAKLFQATKPWCSLVQHEEDDDIQLLWHLHVAEIEYSGYELNRLFRLIADDEVRNILIIHPSKTVVFHPYDGGADVVVVSTKQRDLLKKKYREWLSAHPEGL